MPASEDGVGDASPESEGARGGGGDLAAELNENDDGDKITEISRRLLALLECVRAARECCNDNMKLVASEVFQLDEDCRRLHPAGKRTYIKKAAAVSMAEKSYREAGGKTITVPVDIGRRTHRSISHGWSLAAGRFSSTAVTRKARRCGSTSHAQLAMLWC